MIRVCGSDFPLPGVALTSRVEPLTYRAPKGYRQISGEVMTEASTEPPPGGLMPPGVDIPQGPTPQPSDPLLAEPPDQYMPGRVILKSGGSGTARPAPDPAEQSSRIRSATSGGRLRHALRDGYLAL